MIHSVWYKRGDGKLINIESGQWWCCTNSGAVVYIVGIDNDNEVVFKTAGNVYDNLNGEMMTAALLPNDAGFDFDWKKYIEDTGVNDGVVELFGIPVTADESCPGVDCVAEYASLKERYDQSVDREITHLKENERLRALLYENKVVDEQPSVARGILDAEVQRTLDADDEEDDRIVMAYAEREKYACDVCGSVPDEDGMIEHGRGCYVENEDGGGVTFVEFANNMKIADDEEDDDDEGVFLGVCGDPNCACAGQGGVFSGYDDDDDDDDFDDDDFDDDDDDDDEYFDSPMCDDPECRICYPAPKIDDTLVNAGLPKGVVSLLSINGEVIGTVTDIEFACPAKEIVAPGGSSGSIRVLEPGDTCYINVKMDYE